MPNSPQSMVVCTCRALSTPYIPHLPSFTPQSGPHGVPLPLPFPSPSSHLDTQHPTPNIFTPSLLHSFTPSLLHSFSSSSSPWTFCSAGAGAGAGAGAVAVAVVAPYRSASLHIHLTRLTLLSPRPDAPRELCQTRSDSSPIQGTRVGRTGCSLRTDGQSFDVVLLRRRLCE